MDRRIHRTQREILAAFQMLILSRPYQQVTVKEIVDAANVARSTFYQHFPNKRGLLLHSMAGLLEVLVSCAAGTGRPEAVATLVEHLWENRVLGRLVLNSGVHRQITDTLADMIQQRTGHSRLTSNAIAFAYLGVLRKWLSGDVIASHAEMADWLRAYPRDASSEKQ